VQFVPSRDVTNGVGADNLAHRLNRGQEAAMEDFLLYEKSGGIVTLTMNRPETRNALSTSEICSEFVDRLRAIECDPSVNVVILTGAGPAFCAGGDIKKMRDRSGFAPMKTIIDTRDSYRRTIHQLAKMLNAVEVPMIAAVNGPAIGAGLDLACMCDMRIAARSAKFAESFIKVGIIPGDGGAWFLPRVIGISKASELAFTGDTIDAEEAERIGLVSRVVEDSELMNAAHELASRIDANPGRTLRITKRLIRDSSQLSLDHHLEMAGAFQSIVHETEDHREALDAVLQKRKPAFKNV